MNKTIVAFSLMCAAAGYAGTYPFLLHLEVFNCKPHMYTVNAYPVPGAERQCGSQIIYWWISPSLPYTELSNGSISIDTSGVSGPSNHSVVATGTTDAECAGFVNLVVN